MINNSTGDSFMKFALMISITLMMVGNAAFAGGATMRSCKVDGVKLSVAGRSVENAQLTISMWAQLDLQVNTQDSENPTDQVKATCYNAFKNNDWNRFICIVGRQAVIVKVDGSESCIITSASAD
jgi:hypothetical protein